MVRDHIHVSQSTMNPGYGVMLDRAHPPPASFSSTFIIVLTLATVASMLYLQLWIQVGHYCHLGPLHGKEQCCSYTLTNCLGGISLPRLLLGQMRVVLPSPPLPTPKPLNLPRGCLIQQIKIQDSHLSWNFR